MTFTKKIGLHDRVTVDGEDMSNAFSQMQVVLSDNQVDASGFSVSGTNETLQGARASSITGQSFYTTESHAILYPLYRDRVEFEIEYQPDGLIDPTREVWHGMVRLFDYNPDSTRGNVQSQPITFVSTDETGIVADAAT